MPSRRRGLLLLIIAEVRGFGYIAPCTYSCIKRCGSVSCSEAAKEERLRQLFGDDAAKIAERTGKSRRDQEEKPLEIMMLEEGLQTLEWGAVRLIDVAMAPGPLEATFAPLLPQSKLIMVRLNLPLGMLLEADMERDVSEVALAGQPVVAELLDDGGSAKGGGVEVGDILRATTAVTMGMSYPAWQLMLGGVGRPSLQKVLLTTNGEPFEKVMAAISSNSVQQQGNGELVLVLERQTLNGRHAR